MFRPDDGQKNCPKPVESYSKNKFEKLVRLVGFIIRIRMILLLSALRALFFHRHKGRTARYALDDSLVPNV